VTASSCHKPERSAIMKLDELDRLKSLDSQNFIHDIDTLPDQVAAGWRLGQLSRLPNNYGAITNIVITGSGSSAIGGMLTQALVAPECRVPVILWRDYNLPAFVGLNTLVICSSYSGNTKETLSICEAALARGARLLAITTGGKLAALADKHGAPVWRFEHKGQPRAVGLSFMLTLAVLMKLGLASDKSVEVVEAVKAMRKQQEALRTQVPALQNPAKRLAWQLMDRLGLIFASSYLMPVARYWKEQISEVAKANVTFDELSDLNQNLFVGPFFPEAFVSKQLVIFLRSRHDQSRHHSRSEVMREIYEQSGFNTEAIEAQGQSPLANMLTALHFGDYVAYYLAMAYGLDPFPLPGLPGVGQSPQALTEFSTVSV
jgi:glucose/mannose-6-phosphate isomerase